MWNADDARCPSECFRPVGLALDGKGRTFMTSDRSGELYVISGTNNAGQTTKPNGGDVESGAERRLILQFGKWASWGWP